MQFSVTLIDLNFYVAVVIH